jgi:4-hydroxybenzoate polyprenyltransferase
MIFGILVGPVTSLKGLNQSLFWIWIHLLQCNVSNQYKTREEDLLNKPWRPLPSGRITLDSARNLRWALCGICLSVSSLYSWTLACISLALTFTTIAYDEYGLAGHWVGKNFAGVFGYTTFGAGTLMLMGMSSASFIPVPIHTYATLFKSGQTKALDNIARRALLYNALVIFTTLHAQDFADVDGDRQMFRQTFPIYFPIVSRIVISLAIPIWSVYLTNAWQVRGIASHAIVCIGFWVALRFWTKRWREADAKSYVFYNVSGNLWLTHRRLIHTRSGFS